MITRRFSYASPPYVSQPERWRHCIGFIRRRLRHGRGPVANGSPGRDPGLDRRRQRLVPQCSSGSRRPAVALAGVRPDEATSTNPTLEWRSGWHQYYRSVPRVNATVSVKACSKPPPITGSALAAARLLHRTEANSITASVDRAAAGIRTGGTRSMAAAHQALPLI